MKRELIDQAYKYSDGEIADAFFWLLGYLKESDYLNDAFTKAFDHVAIK